MNDFIHSITSNSTPFNVTHFSLLPLPNARTEFAELAARFFVEQWMEIEAPEMLDVWQNWNSSSDDKKNAYKGYLNEALFSKGLLVDDADAHQYKPLSTFTETMLRWIRKSFLSEQLMIEPPVPRPP